MNSGFMNGKRINKHALKLVSTDTSRFSDAKIPYKDKRVIENPLSSGCSKRLTEIQ